MLYNRRLIVSMWPPQSKLLDPTEKDTEEYKTMIQDRLKEGHGEFMMEIGLEGTNSQ